MKNQEILNELTAIETTIHKSFKEITQHEKPVAICTSWKTLEVVQQQIMNLREKLIFE